MEQCLAPPANIALLSGPQLLGLLFNWGLFGVLTVQVYIYHIAFGHDARYIQSLVYSLYVLEVVQVVMTTHDAFATLGAGWGNLDALNDPHLLWFDTPVLSGLIACTVQLFFSWRIYLLSRSKLLCGFICALALTQGVGGVVTGIMVHFVAEISEIQEKTFKPNIVWLGGSALCDITIAFCMFFFLSKSRTGHAATDQLLSRLVRLTVETGVITAGVAIIDLALFFAFQHNNLHMVPSLILAKLYTNSLMALFNNRAQISKGTNGHASSAVPQPAGEGFFQRYRNGKHPTAVTVDVTRETVTDRGDRVAMVDMIAGDDKYSPHNTSKMGSDTFKSCV